MNQTIIRMIGKLEEDKKARWSVHLPELLMAYNATCSAVTGYSPYYLLFGRRPRIPVDYQFPTISNPPHHTKMEQTVAAMQKRLEEAFAVARQLTSEEAKRQCRYYDRNARAVAVAQMRLRGSVRLKIDGRREALLWNHSWRTGQYTRSDVFQAVARKRILPSLTSKPPHAGPT